MNTKAKAGLAVLVLASVVGLVSPAVAQDAGFYAGASLGQASAKEVCDDLGGTGISCDDKDTAWKIFGGYQLNRNFALEFGYADLGEVTATFGALRETVKATAFEFVGIGSLPVADRFAIYGKLGIYRAEIDDETNFAGSTSESNTDLTFGFGIRFDVTRNLALRAEWQRYKDVGGADVGGESDIDVISIGALFRF